MKYQIGQTVWIWRGDKDKPYPATITDLCGIGMNGEYVWEFEHIDEETGWRCFSFAVNLTSTKRNQMRKRHIKNI